MAPLRVTNYLFASLRLFGVMMFLALILIFSFAPMDPTPSGKPPDRAVVVIVAIPFGLVFLYAFLRGVLWVEIGGQVTVKRVMGGRVYSWADIKNVSFETSRGSFNFIQVAKFRSMTLTFPRGSAYLRMTPETEALIKQVLMQLESTRGEKVAPTSTFSA